MTRKKLEGFHVFLNNKEAKQQALYLCFTMIATAVLFYFGNDNTTFSFAIMSLPLLVILYSLFVEYKTILVCDQELLIYYPFRVFWRFRSFPISEIRKVGFSLNKVNPYRIINLSTKSRKLPFQFSLADSSEFEQCLLVLIKEGRFNLVSSDKTYDYIEGFLKDYDLGDRITLGKSISKQTSN